MHRPQPPTKSPRKMPVESSNSRFSGKPRSAPGPEGNPASVVKFGPSGCLSETGDTRVLVKLGQRTVFRAISALTTEDYVVNPQRGFSMAMGLPYGTKTYEGFVYILRCLLKNGEMLTLRVPPLQPILSDTGWTLVNALRPLSQRVAVLNRKILRRQGNRVDKLSISMEPFVLIKEYSMVRDRVWAVLTEDGIFSANRFFLKVT